MTQRRWIGTALGLALLSTGLASCSRGDEASRNPPAEQAIQLEWSGSAEKQLREAIAGAPAHGLKPELFLNGELPGGGAERDAALTRAALRYADALARGYSDPAKVHEHYTLPRPKVDVRAGLARALEQGNLGEWLNSLAPQTDEYRALSQAFLEYNQQASAAAAQPRPAAARKGNPTSPEADPAARARQLAVAMERLRWLERSAPATRIDVNTAAAFLEYWSDGARVDRRKVVVGEPGWETPQLGTPMFQLVANPIWRVPDSIMEDEIAEKSPTWLAENGFEMRDGRMVQLSGPKNSLGLVKFDLHNKDMIYLHDTPAKALFQLDDRHRSHGCVRVQDALGFAQLIAEHDGIASRFAEAIASEDESFVKLKTDIPVRLLYHTAFVEGGRIVFVDDAYGWDEDVAYAIGLKRYPRPKPPKRQDEADVGP